MEHYIVDSYLFSEKCRSQQHYENQTCAFEHIGGADFDMFEYLLPADCIGSHDTNRTCQAKAISSEHELVLRSVLRKDRHASVKQIDANEGTICEHFR